MLRRSIPALVLVLAVPAGAAEAAFTVTNTNDSGAGSLREAIDDADANPGTDSIVFSIPGSPPFTIDLASQLKIDDSVVLDATTQPGFSGTPIVVLDGSGLPSNHNCLRIVSGGTTVAGLVIRDCPRNGVRLETAGGNTVVGNYIGTDGISDRGNGSDGILIVGVSSNTIGGTSAGDRNVISGNDANGIRITAGGSGNVIAGNYIGTNAAGTAAIGNGSGSGSGIFIDDGSGNTIGGTTHGHRNVISGNGVGNGVFLSGASTTGNTVRGNYIGTNATGTGPLANADGGVTLSGAPGNSILNNLISGNGPGAVGAGVKLQVGADSNVVRGNLIGLNAAGDAPVPNFRGVFVAEAADNTIGGPSSGHRNVISGNDSSGVVLQGPGTSGNIVQGNYIGLDTAGATALGNDGEGLNVSGITGLPVADNELLDNVVSASSANGIHIHDGPTGTVVRGNFVGTNAAGTAARPNASNGVKIAGTDGALLGGSAPGDGNVISGNSANGVLLDFASGVLIQGNLIGTRADGAGALGNTQRGLRVTNGSNTNLIGGTAAGEGNTIAFNGSDGIEVEDGSFNAVRGNSFVDNGDLAVDLGAAGVNANDGPVDPDAGANDLQNYPVLDSALRLDSQVTVEGSLDGVQGTTFDVDLFASPACDPSGHGEGKVFLGTVTVSTNSSGTGDFSAAIGAVSVGWQVTATATDPSGNTSELSACREVVCGPGCIFADGMESGDLSEWSSQSPP